MQPVTEAERGSVTFRFKNIGPVTSAELELGDLTVVAGRNNTGKTYLVYTLYGFLTMWDTWPVQAELSRREDNDSSVAGLDTHHSVLKRIFDDLLAHGEAVVPVSRDALDKERKDVIDDLTRAFSNDALSGVFSSSPDEFKNASIAVDLGSAAPVFPLSVDLTVRSDETVSVRYDGMRIVVSTSAPRRKQIDPAELLRYVSRLYLRLLFPELAQSRPLVLSAERFGISLFYKELDFTKNQLVDLLQKWGDRKKRERFFPFFLIDQSLSRYAMPVKDNIDYTRSISDLVKQRSEVHDDHLFDDIRWMMNGYYKASKDNIEFRSVTRGTRRFAIPLHLASSSARGLSDLYFFLRHVASKDHLVIIDEPESHLDTANQIRLARLLARMVQVGLKVLLTTHSDYLIKEINNLIMLSGSFADKANVTKAYGYRKQECILPETVRAYVAENSVLTRCKVDRFGIDMPVFDETIDKINGVANDLAARLAEGSAD